MNKAPAVGAEEWLRDIAQHGIVMSVRLTGPIPEGLSDGGDLYPETIAEVLAVLDATRAELEVQWAANHMEHCGQLFVDHRAGTKICTWPRPAMLPPGFPDVWPG